MGLINYYRKDKEFPSTLTSSVWQLLMMNGMYDDYVTLPILNGTRHNWPFKQLLMIDVVKPNVIKSLLEGTEAADEQIDKDKWKRMPVICSLMSNLMKMTDVHMIQVILDEFLIRDYDHKGGSKVSANPLNMIFVLNQMINNCYIDSAGKSISMNDDQQEASVDYYNLTNDVYIQLIDELIKLYISNFEESFSNETISQF